PTTRARLPHLAALPHAPSVESGFSWHRVCSTRSGAPAPNAFRSSVTQQVLPFRFNRPHQQSPEPPSPPAASSAPTASRPAPRRAAGARLDRDCAAVPAQLGTPRTGHPQPHGAVRTARRTRSAPLPPPEHGEHARPCPQVPEPDFAAPVLGAPRRDT